MTNSTQPVGDRYAARPRSVGRLHHGGSPSLTLLRRGATALISVLVALSPIGALSVAADGLAVDDTYSVAEDGVLTVPMETGVLANDAGGSLVLCVSAFVTTGLEGALTEPPGIAADGSFTYTPPPNFNGTTTFTYDVATLVAGVCPPPPTTEGTGTVTITVTPVNDAPTAAGDSFTALANHTLNVAAPGVLGNDADVDGDTLPAVKKANPAHGVVTLAEDGAFSDTPDTGYTGADQFSYGASDGPAPSTSVSLPSTPGAATVSGVSSAVV